jgi:DNA invertase Pin-like site-specific DNA recombinase
MLQAAILKPIVAYYRVSTDKQGRSGLGLEAQQKAVQDYAAIYGRNIVAAFTEIESGANADREQLALALGEARRIKGTLVIAKLDRLARDVHFVSGLMKSGVDFVAADMPSADKTMIQIFAVMGEWERDRISERTRAALAAAKARGVKLGNPAWAETIDKARAAKCDRARAWAENILPTIRSIQVQGQPRPSLREIAAELNRRGIRTARGGKWYAATVQRVIEAE